MKFVLLFFLFFHFLLQAGYIKDSNRDVIIDLSTSLIWQDSNDTSSVKRSFEDAVSYCENLDFADYSDWRLPNFNELYLLADRTKANPAISQEFEYVGAINLQDFYWSSTTSAQSSTTAWALYFHYGSGVQKEKSELGYVRCVRGGK